MVEFLLKAVAPKVQYNPKAFTNDIRRRVKNIQERTRRRYKSTTRTWKRKPKFFVRSKRGPDIIAIYAGTDNIIYKYVDEGTDPHPIEAVNAPYLVFNPNFRSKTVPRVLSSRQGGHYGNTLVKVKKVDHPGTEAREFTKIISKKAQKEMQDEMNEALRVWLQKMMKF